MTIDKSTQADLAEQKKPETKSDYFSNLDFSKLEIDISEMFKNGVHFGHHKSRRNPKMDKHIFTTRSGINIINLENTKENLIKAMEFIKKIISENQDVLFIGTKKQAKSLVESLAKTLEMPYVSERWLGGTFTNFSIIAQRTRYLREGLLNMKNGEYEKYTKFEKMKIAQELSKMERKMGGIKNMVKLPGAIFVASITEDSLAVKEAQAKNIPVVALVDTNVNPKNIDYPIPANEDAVSSLRLLLSYIGKAVLEGKGKRAEVKSEIKESGK
jgi:small subunit ribosomal protein S2